MSNISQCHLKDIGNRATLQTDSHFTYVYEDIGRMKKLTLQLKLIKHFYGLSCLN